MSAKDGKAKSVVQRVANRAHERGLTRQDALVAYAMDRLLYRLGRSAHAREFFLKGGVLVANLVDAPHRFTRDIDLLRRHGPPDLDEIRQRFREIAAVVVDDGLVFDEAGVRAVEATRELDGYDGVRVTLGAKIGGTNAEVRIDIGFGDAVVPPAERLSLATFLDGDPAASVYAYDAGPVLAEKIETLIAKWQPSSPTRSRALTSSCGRCSPRFAAVTHRHTGRRVGRGGGDPPLDTPVRHGGCITGGRRPLTPRGTPDAAYSAKATWRPSGTGCGLAPSTSPAYRGQASMPS